MRKLLGEMLMEDGIITEKSLNEVLEIQKKDGVMLGALLVKLGYIDDEILLEYLRMQGTRIKQHKRSH